MLNRTVLNGRMTRNPELRRTQNDVPVVTFRIAVDRDYQTKDGEKKTDFFDVTAWRQKAEFVAKYFEKGQLILVDGRLETDIYTDKEGIKRQTVKVVADEVYFGSNKKTEENDIDVSDFREFEYAEDIKCPF